MMGPFLDIDLFSFPVSLATLDLGGSECSLSADTGLVFNLSEFFLQLSSSQQV